MPENVRRTAREKRDRVAIGRVGRDDHDRRAPRRKVFQSGAREEEPDQRMGQIVQPVSLPRRCVPYARRRPRFRNQPAPLTQLPYSYKAPEKLSKS